MLYAAGREAWRPRGPGVHACHKRWSARARQPYDGVTESLWRRLGPCSLGSYGRNCLTAAKATSHRMSCRSASAAVADWT